MANQTNCLPDNPNIQVIKTKKTGLFTNYIYKAIPLAFDESLSYYETLCGLLNYLKDTVIPTVNNNADAMEELQKLFIQLNDYVANYFKNLDVQEEIDNKLDEMTEDGTLTQLIERYVNPIYQNFENSINNTVSELEKSVTSINDKVNKATNGSPRGAYDSVDDLINANPNHDYIYVVISTGKWYYYNNTTSSWTAGGDYQSTGITNNSIDILMLDNKIANNFNTKFGSPLNNSTTQGNDGYYLIDYNDKTKMNFVPNDDWKSYKIDLELYGVYCFTGFNQYDVKSLFICDSNNNIIYYTEGTDLFINNTYPVSTLFNVKQSELYAYISINRNLIPYNNLVNIRKLTNIYNNLNIASNILTPLFTLENKYISYSGTTDNNYITLTNAENYTLNVYPIAKGLTYTIEYNSFSDSRSACYTNLANKLKWIPSTDESGIYEFTADEDGYMYLCNNPGYLNGTITLINKVINVINSSILQNKKLVYDGDSICESRVGTANNGGAYAKIISDLTNSTYRNYAVGGGRLSHVADNSRHSVVDNLVNLDNNADLYCFEGGVNDYWGNVPLGEFNAKDYTGDVDISTITGALEQIFRYSITNFIGKPIVFVIIHKIADPFVLHNGYNFPMLRERIIQVCNKYSIPYYDAYNYSGLNGMNEVQRTNYLNANATGTPDGTHPNKQGYERYYVPQLLNIFENIIKR